MRPCRNLEATTSPPDPFSPSIFEAPSPFFPTTPSDIESILDNDAPDYASTLTGADEEDNIIQRYLNDHHDSTIVRILMKRFQGIYIPKISIEKEIKKYRCVGVDEKIALPKGCLITISRKWSSRAKDAEKRGKKVFPDLYYASPELVQRASVQH